MNASTLKLFSDPHLLRLVGRPILAKFFECFTQVLPSKYFLPNPRVDNDAYFDSLASVLEHTSELPEPVLKALLEVEALAPTKDLDNDPQNVSISASQNFSVSAFSSDAIPLSQAIQAWLRSAESPAVPISDLRPRISDPPPPAVPTSDLRSPTSAIPSVSAFSEEAPPPPVLPSPAVLHSSFSALPSAEPVDGNVLLLKLVDLLKRFVILPQWAAEAIALWILHTYAFHLRDVTAYIGIQSPEKRCGKTTLLSLLSELAHRAVASSNISPPAFFRVIEDFSPTLLIDEVDTFLTGNDQLRGILNAGCHRKTGFVLRAAPSPRLSPRKGAAVDSPSPGGEGRGEGELSTHSSGSVVECAKDLLEEISSASCAEAESQDRAMGAIKRYSCWCPKALAKIGRFPDTLADRCIIIRMQRKTSAEKCDRSRELDALPLKQQCLRFVADHSAEIAAAKPQLPPELNDRAADIWEPLLVLADLAGADWPELARKAAIGLSASAQDHNPISSLLLDIFLLFTTHKVERIFTRSLVAQLNAFSGRPWAEMHKGKPIGDLWLSQQLRPYGVQPRNIWIDGSQAKGYLREDFTDVFRRYIHRAELKSMLDDSLPPQLPPSDETKTN